MRKVLVTCVLAGVLLVAVLGLTAALIPARPHEYRSEVFIELPVAESWRLLGDLSLAHHYVPGVVRTEVTTQRKRGIGASRRVYSSDTDYINETVTAWQEGRGFTLALHTDDGSAPAPFREAAFTYELRAVGEARTLLQTRLLITMRGGAVGEWLARKVMAGTFESRLDAVSGGLKRLYESDHTSAMPGF